MYVCGWDGGGTKTEVCVMDAVGAFLPSGFFGPLNINGASADKVAQTVRDSVAFMSKQSGGLEACAGLVIGMAGASNENAVRQMEAMVRSAGYSGPLRIVGDQEIALAGAVEGPGAVLIAGTGAICFGRDEAGNRHRVGGFGYLIDDGGSGYAIGRDILAAAARSSDGRMGKTFLEDLVYEALGVSHMGGVITWLYAPATGKKEVASLAPLLLKALEQKDEAAQAIAEKAARDLSELALTFWRKAELTEGELAMTGSILNRYASIRARTEEIIRAALPAAAILSPRRTPAQGAALLARS